MERKEKEYTFTVYRTVQQSVQIIVPTNREADTKELEQLANEAEWLAGELGDGEWKIEEVDTMYAIYEEYAKKE